MGSSFSAATFYTYLGNLCQCVDFRTRKFVYVLSTTANHTPMPLCVELLRCQHSLIHCWGPGSSYNRLQDHYMYIAPVWFYVSGVVPSPCLIPSPRMRIHLIEISPHKRRQVHGICMQDVILPRANKWTITWSAINPSYKAWDNYSLCTARFVPSYTLDPMSPY